MKSVKSVKSVATMIKQAEKKIKTLTPKKAREMQKKNKAILVDIRDVRELQIEGVVPGAVHAPRGMLEFWIDPKSPYYKEVFGEDKTYIFFCAAAGRSALATKDVQGMGLKPVAHIKGGFALWKKEKLPVTKYGKKTKTKTKPKAKTKTKAKAATKTNKKMAKVKAVTKTNKTNKKMAKAAKAKGKK